MMTLTMPQRKVIQASKEKGIVLAERYGVSASLIGNIKRGDVGGYVRKTDFVRLTPEQRRDIIDSTARSVDLARSYDVTCACICAIRKGKVKGIADRAPPKVLPVRHYKGNFDVI